MNMKGRWTVSATKQFQPLLHLIEETRCQTPKKVKSKSSKANSQCDKAIIQLACTLCPVPKLVLNDFDSYFLVWEQS
jgi:hypothetical protein